LPTRRNATFSSTKTTTTARASGWAISTTTGCSTSYFGANLAGDRLYLNKGNLVFEDITARAGIKNNGGWSSGVTVADVNADGRPDIYVCRDLYDDRPDLRTNQLYLNNGDLTFTESAKAYGLNDAWRSRHATFLDYDRDGDLDCYLLNQPPNPGNFSEMLHVNTADTVYTARLYRNNGNQTFTDVSRQAGVVRAGYALGVGVADYNFDGWPDLYVANDFDAPDFFYVNNGDGTFTNRLEGAVKHTSNSSMGVDVADVNNDGLHDIFVADMAAEDNARQKTNLGPMGPAQFRKVLGRGGYYQYMYNTLQVGNGNGTFSEVAHLAGVSSTDWSWSPLLADFDNDGYKDLHVTNGFRRDIRDNDVTRTFPNYVHNLVEKTTAGRPDAGDINFWDVVNLPELLSLVPSEKLANYVFRNNGDLTFTPKMAAWGMDAKTFSNGSAYGDLDNDGDLDLVVSNIDEVAHIYRNNAEKVTGNRYLRVLLRTDPKVLPAFGAKVYAYYGGAQQFQETTNVRGFYSTSEPAVHFGLGRTEKVDRLVVRWPDGKESILRDVPANQVVAIHHADATPAQPTGETAAQPLFAADPGSGIRYRHVENDFDDFAEQGLLPHNLSTFGPGLAVADADGDGLEDFFVGGAAGSAGQLFRQHPDGTFSCTQTGPWLADKAAEDLDALFFDADGDGDPDLYVVSGGGEFPAGSPLYQDRLYRNDGEGNFRKAADALPALPHSGSRVKAADFDGDGDLDLFVGGRLLPGEYPRPGRSCLLQNDGGRFTDVTNTLAPGLAEAGMVTDAAWSDFDRDGRPDLVVVGEWMPVTFFRNAGGALYRRDGPRRHAGRDGLVVQHRGRRLRRRRRRRLRGRQPGAQLPLQSHGHRAVPRVLRRLRRQRLGRHCAGLPPPGYPLPAGGPQMVGRAGARPAQEIRDPPGLFPGVAGRGIRRVATGRRLAPPGPDLCQHVLPQQRRWHVCRRSPAAAGAKVSRQRHPFG
jgi:hypothetical protein